MFRPAVLQTLRRAQQHASTANSNNITNHAQRLLVTSAQKRALNKEQISGSQGPSSPSTTTAAAATTANSTTTTTDTTSTTELPTSKANSTGSGTTPSPPPPPSNGGSSIVPIVAIASAGIGGAYYMDLLPFGKTEETIVNETTTVKTSTSTPSPSKSEEAIVTKENITEEKKVVKDTKDKNIIAKEEVKKEKKDTSSQKEVSTPKTETTSVGNRVLNIHAPSSVGRKSEALPSVEHNPNGNRVSVEKFNQIYGAQVVESPSPSLSTTTPTTTSPSIIQTQKELTSSKISSHIDDALIQAHVTMRATIEDSFLKDLDTLNENELKIRIIQLASEMGERTKWEAVRLREFLGMKEKEVDDK